MPEKMSIKALDRALSDALRKVLSTMVSSDAYLKYSADTCDIPLFGRRPVVTSAVGFSGQIKGTLYFYMEEAVALIVAGRFLQMDKQELLEEGEETINDTLGEFANMTGGDFKVKLSEARWESALTLPSIVRGTGLTITNTSAEVQRFHIFDFEEKALLAFLSLGYAD